MSNGYNLRNRQDINQPERFRQEPPQRYNSLSGNDLPGARTTGPFTNTNVFATPPVSRNPSNFSALSGISGRGGNTKKYRARSKKQTKKNKSRRHKKPRSKRRAACVRGAWYCK
jgi:hypothetical protein